MPAFTSVSKMSVRLNGLRLNQYAHKFNSDQSTRPQTPVNATETPTVDRLQDNRSGAALLRRRWRELGLGRQKVVYALAGIVTTMAVLASWMSNRIESGVLATMAAASSFYMESHVSPLLQGLGEKRELPPEVVAGLDTLSKDPVFHRHIVSIKIWASDGRVLYAPDKSVIGRRYPLSVQLLAALAGRTEVEYDRLTAEENEPEKALGVPLAEIYSPIRDGGSGRVIAVAEFYAIADSLQDELSRTRLECWIIVGLISLLVLSALVGLISGDGATIVRQERALQDRVEQLSRLLVQNEDLRDRLLEARRGAVETNERVLRRIGADLHDGPAQLIGLALLRLDNLLPEDREPDIPAMRRELEKIRTALTNSLSEVRAVSSGIAPPALDRVTPADAVEMAIENHEQLTGTEVTRELEPLPSSLPSLLKTCLYRFAQEGLTNAFRHARGSGQVVRAGVMQGTMYLEVEDDGPGFALDYVPSTQRGLGLAGLRDRVESLGGRFVIRSEKGRSTVLRCEFVLEQIGDV